MGNVSGCWRCDTVCVSVVVGVSARRRDTKEAGR